MNPGTVPTGRMKKSPFFPLNTKEILLSMGRDSSVVLRTQFPPPPPFCRVTLGQSLPTSSLLFLPFPFTCPLPYLFSL